VYIKLLLTKDFHGFVNQLLDLFFTKKLVYWNVALNVIIILPKVPSLWYVLIIDIHYRMNIWKNFIFDTKNWKEIFGKQEYHICGIVCSSLLHYNFGCQIWKSNKGILMLLYVEKMVCFVGYIHTMYMMYIYDTSAFSTRMSSMGTS
jgi:hypothetical protein